MVPSDALKTWLTGLEIMEPIRSGPLQVFGLRKQSLSPLSYATLDEALQEESLEVTEVNQAGEVPHLKVINRGDSRVFLMAGEELVGAKQNRVLNVSLVVDGHSEVEVPVSCVEQGRWRYASPKFGVSPGSAHRVLRAKLAHQAGKAYDRSGVPHSDQAEVWKEIRGKLHRLNSHSPSDALLQAYLDHAKPLDAICQDIPPTEGAVGVVYVVARRIAGMDIFRTPSTLHKLSPKLVRVSALDSLE